MGIIKSGKFWGGVFAGVIGLYVYHNYVKGRMG